jgi:hypothetical protein
MTTANLSSQINECYRDVTPTIWRTNVRQYISRESEKRNTEY